MPQSSLQVTSDWHRAAGMRNLLGKASPAHTDTLGAHGDPSARGQTANHAKVQTGKRPWDFPAPPSHKPLTSSCLWMLLVAGTEMGPHKRALNTPSPAPPPYPNLHFPSHQHRGTKMLVGLHGKVTLGTRGRELSKSCWKSRQSTFPALFPCLLQDSLDRLQGTAPQNHPFSTGSQ